MNVLARLQKVAIEKKGTPEYQYAKEIFLSRYYELRQKEAQRFYSRLTLETRLKLHPLILGIYKVKNRLSGFTYEVISDKHQATNRPIIFAITHVGKFDIEVVSEAVREHYTLLTGDFEHLQGTLYAPFLGLNGAIYFNEKVKADRRAAQEKMIEILCQGGNLMYFPEGTWNLHPALPVLPCYWGIIDVAWKGNAAIVPIAAEQYEKHFKINLGENFDVFHYPSTNEGKRQAISDLRDALATLKWEIWETETAKRVTIQPLAWDKYVNARFREWSYFDMEYIQSLIYHPKEVTEPDDAYAHLSKMIPCRENAFLLGKQSTIL